MGELSNYPCASAELSEIELRALFRLSERIRTERKPEDSPLLYENFTASLLNIPPVMEFSFWAVWNVVGDEAIARGNVAIPLMEGNEHLGQMDLQNNQPANLMQALTAVLSAYRNRSLGRWLKAAMVEKVLDELPDARVILADNATENAAMLSINTEMGFRPGSANAVWHVTVDVVEAYLAEREKRLEPSS